VPENEKEEATEKFKILGKIHSVLTDSVKRSLYDAQGVVDDEEDDTFGAKWMEIWKQFFKPISESDIDNYAKQYVGSELERNDIRKAYVNGKGCWNFIFNHIPFFNVEDEPRVMEIVKEWIAAGEVEAFDQFLNEHKGKHDRRHKKYAKEAREAAEIKRQQQQPDDDLVKQLAARQQHRASSFMSMLDRLADKYGDGDEEDDSEMYALPASKKMKKGKKKQTSTKPAEHRTKSGRVSKK
jgi:DnaJ homolog subfamily C member 9